MTSRFVGVLITGMLCAGMLFSCSKKVTKVEQQAAAPLKTAGVIKERDNTRAKDLDRIQDVLVPIYFDFDLYTLKSEELPKLERIASLLSKTRNVRLVCEGHCDERGSDDYNMGLGDNRARAIKNWLTAYGITDVQVETTSYGKQMPAASHCSDDYCHSRNRRAEWRIIAQ